LLNKMGLDVSLGKPDARVGCYKIGDRYYVGLARPLGRDYESRKPQDRPFFHPTSMHPKLARALVNLSRVLPGETLLDPFCGTGGILIEAGLCGLEPVGWDIDQDMIDGCRKNLDHYGLEARLEKKDAVSEAGEELDAIATDPPYGRSSYSSKKTSDLFEDFVENAYRMLAGTGRLVLMSPDELEYDTGGFKVVDVFRVRMHKSLTRRITVLEK